MNTQRLSVGFADVLRSTLERMAIKAVSDVNVHTGTIDVPLVTDSTFEDCLEVWDRVGMTLVHSAAEGGRRSGCLGEGMSTEAMEVVFRDFRHFLTEIAECFDEHNNVRFDMNDTASVLFMSVIWRILPHRLRPSCGKSVFTPIEIRGIEREMYFFVRNALRAFILTNH